MAILRTSGIIPAITGRLAGMTFARGPRGTSCWLSPRTTSTPSIHALEQRAFYAAAAAAWRALTEQERAAWRHAARIHPIPNRLGVFSPLAARAVFFQQFLWGRTFAGMPIPDPPLDQTTSAANGISTAFSIAGRYAILIDTPPPPVGFFIQVIGRPLWRPGRRVRTCSLRKLHMGFWIPPTISVKGEWIDRYGPLRIDQPFGVAVRFWTPLFWPSPWVTATGTAAP